MILALFLAFAGFAAAKQQDRGFTERVEVNVRTVLAVVTDSKGQPLATPLTADDVLVFEDGVPAKVLAVEAVRTSAPPARPSPALSAPAPQPAAPPPAKPAIEAVDQILYVDATLLGRRSPLLVAQMLESRVDPLLARGRLEIVVADAEPKTVLPATSDAAAVRAALADLGKKVAGRDRIREIRRDLSANPGTSMSGSGLSSPVVARERAMHARSAIQQEIQLLTQSLGRLERWAADRPGRGPAVLYLASDGFDVNPTEFYENWLRSESTASGATDAAQIRAEFQSQVPDLVGRTAERLANRSMLTVTLAVGGADASFGQDAATVGHREGNDLRRQLNAPATFLFVRPLDPLRLISDATGGEVVTQAARFDVVLDRLSRAVAITYRMDRPPDGKPHKLEVKSRREGVILRAAHSVVSEKAGAVAAARSIEAFDISADRGNLPLTAAVEATGTTAKGRLTGKLGVTADLESFVPALEKVGPGRLRVTIAIEAKGFQPFVQSDEMDLGRSGNGTLWHYEAPIEWPSAATRVAVTVEELKTGARGTVVAAMPREAAAASPVLDPSQPALPVRIEIDEKTAAGDRLQLTVSVHADIVQILQPLAQAGAARLHIEIIAISPSRRDVVATADRSIPFRDVDEIVVPLSVTCSSSTRQLIVTVDETVTKRRGTASVSVPQPN